MALKHRLNEQITVETAGGADGNGKPTYGTGAVCRTRYVQKITELRDPQGAQIIAQGRLILEPGTTIAPQDRVTLPDGRKEIVLAVKTAKKGNGQPNHKVAYI